MKKNLLLFFGGLVAGILFNKAILAVIILVTLLWLIIGSISKDN